MLQVVGGKSGYASELAKGVQKKVIKFNWQQLEAVRSNQSHLEVFRSN